MSDSVIPKSERRSLRCDFSAVEIQEMSFRLANKIKELASQQEEKKSQQKQADAKINITQAEITKLSNFVSDGYEFREVECPIAYNTPEPGKKTLTRSDNQQPIVERMEQWEHNLFTQVTDDDFLESSLDSKKKRTRKQPLFDQDSKDSAEDMVL